MNTDKIMKLARQYRMANWGDGPEWKDLFDAIQALQADAALWRRLYSRAINEANGLTNYVEDRPELYSAEKRITKIEAEARAAMALDKP